jgi:hypothetical protein
MRDILMKKENIGYFHAYFKLNYLDKEHICLTIQGNVSLKLEHNKESPVKNNAEIKVLEPII